MFTYCDDFLFISINNAQISVAIGRRRRQLWRDHIREITSGCQYPELLSIERDTYIGNEDYRDVHSSMRSSGIPIKTKFRNEIMSFLESIDDITKNQLYRFIYGKDGTLSYRDIFSHINYEAAKLLGRCFLFHDRHTLRFQQEEYTCLLELLSNSEIYREIPRGACCRVNGVFMAIDRSIRILTRQYRSLVSIAKRHNVIVPCDGFHAGMWDNNITLLPGRHVGHEGSYVIQYVHFPFDAKVLIKFDRPSLVVHGRRQRLYKPIASPSTTLAEFSHACIPTHNMTLPLLAYQRAGRIPWEPQYCPLRVTFS